MKRLFCLIVFVFIFPLYSLPFKQVVIWGHKLHSHTHSYIHAAFYKAFCALGYSTLWLDNYDTIEEIDFSQTLFITEGQVDQKMPHRDDSWYVLHNCDARRYTDLQSKNRCIVLQVYTHDVLKRSAEKIEPCIYYDISGRVIYMPWATDLLPSEVDTIRKNLTLKKDPFVSFIGTIGGGHFGNVQEINAFKKASIECGMPFVHKVHVDLPETIALTQTAFMAPALQGPWQVEKGYIPCRIFKNISYGAFGITNSKTVWELFDKKIIYNPDCYQLFYDAKRRIEEASLSYMHDLMDLIKNRHTYINRINHLLVFFDRVIQN